LALLIFSICPGFVMFATTWFQPPIILSLFHWHLPLCYPSYPEQFIPPILFTIASLPQPTPTTFFSTFALFAQASSCSLILHNAIYSPWYYRACGETCPETRLRETPPTTTTFSKTCASVPANSPFSFHHVQIE